MIGVYYYPEQWPEEQWERDIQNIKKMGMKHIHLAEFSWIHLEPEEGEYDFSWLDRTIVIAQENNLEVILCTPTATPPIWMSHHYPTTLMVRQNGRRVTHGSRAHRCVNSKVFNTFAVKMATALAQRYGTNESITGWQLDNEVGHYANAACYCDECLIEFRTYLESKYSDIKQLNRAWGGGFLVSKLPEI